MTSSTTAEVKLGSGSRIAARGARSQAQTGGFWSWITAALEPLASLRLTVTLLLLGVFVVWVASLQQTRTDIWAVKSQHFPKSLVEVPEKILVYIPFRVFFPPAWFPGLQTIQGGCFLPSGFAVLLAMIVNLLAAHLVRMRVQAQGLRLWGGVVVAVLGLGVTWLIVFGAQNPDGFQAEYSPEFFRWLWRAIQATVVGVGLAAAIASWRMQAAQMLEKIVLGSIAAFMLMAFGVLLWLGDQAFVGDSAMRILWQLIQGTMAAAVMMVASAMIFKRKGAIVLIHLGILMLMGNEIYVSLTNVEQRMLVGEGETASHTVDIRHQEMFVARVSPDEQEVSITTIDRPLLIPGETVQDPSLPFAIECLEYFENAELERVTPEAGAMVADSGLGRFFRPIPLPPGSGVDSDQSVDRPAAYVRLVDKTTGDPLGTYLMSTIAYDGELLDQVTVGDASYYIGLRYRHIYKDYSIHLTDVEQELYDGTSVPRSYSSDFLLTDTRRGLVDDPQRVWMNNPLRYGDETFYQSSYGSMADGQEYTVLQIVKNKGWMIPYVACMFVVLGLLGQFSGTLSEFLFLRDSAAATTRSWLAMGVMLFVMIYVGVTIYGSTRNRVDFSGMRLEQLGRIPVLYKGRVQPLDSIARNVARQLGARETVMAFDGKTKMPAIRWFADLIYRSPGWESYKLLRITDLNVLNELDLEPGNGFRYSLDDLKGSVATLERLVKDARQVPEADLTNAQKRLIDVQQKITLVKNLQLAFGDPTVIEEQEGVMTRLLIGAEVARSSELPRAAPMGEDVEDWQALVTLHNRQWLQEQATRFGVNRSRDLAAVFAEEYLLRPLRQQMEQEDVIRRLLQDPDVQRALNNAESETGDPQQARMEALSKLPPEKLVAVQREAKLAVDKAISANRDEYVQRTEALIDAIGFEESPPLGSGAEALLDLGDLYLAKKADEFNSTLGTYLDGSVVQAPEARPRQVATEVFYNSLSPFYLAMVLYILGFGLAIGAFVGWTRTLGSAATYVILVGLAVHVLGIILRVVISGRPPVTSLYTSFIFISACSVGLLLVIERLTRINVASVLGAIAGSSMLLWAWTMTIKEGDTFTVLVAVLDTQFWLSTHVICISLGYVTTIVAGLLGAACLLMSLFGVTWQRPIQKGLVKIVYGVTCFGLLFSFFGTVLGGLWADDSWGRFWGWDTKENGALMIVFWNAVLLHARWGGIIRERGIAAVATLGIAVTFWSWQGVNLLGVGLHNYGFSEEGLWVMFGVVVVSGVVAAIGLLPHRDSGKWKSA